MRHASNSWQGDYLTSAIKTSPTMTSGSLRANSRTLSPTQSAAFIRSTFEDTLDRLEDVALTAMKSP
jgi:hypothetical protein